MLYFNCYEAKLFTLMKAVYPYFYLWVFLWMLLGGSVGTVAAESSVLPGTLDPAFQVQLHASGSLGNVAVQADGKLLVVGRFSDFNGASAPSLARLNTDGSVDTSFQPTAGALLGAVAFALQSDGRIVVSGQFRSPDGTAFSSIDRLNADGTPDSSFAANIMLDDEAYRILLQPDGKVLIGGYFTTVNGVTRNHLARLNADGSLDTSFNLGADMTFIEGPLAVQADGKILFASTYLNVGGVAYPGLVRLNTDGSIDPSYQSSLMQNTSVNTIALLADGKALISGNLGNAQSVERLNMDGTVDASFNAGSFDTTPVGVILVSDGEVVVNGNFTQVQGLLRPGIVRLRTDGSVDSAFVPPADGLVGEQYADSDTVAAQADGKLVLVGRFVFVGSQPSPSIARFNLDGSLDTSFHPGTGAGAGSPSGVAEALAVQPDGKVLIGGEFSFVNGVPSIGYARLNADGSLDASFKTGTGTGTPGQFQSKPLPGIVDAFSIQPDGKIIVAGFFDHLGGQIAANSGRLNPDGSVDAGFVPPLTAGGLNIEYGLIQALALQPDGKVMVAGSFDNPTANLARFNANGSLDTGFNPALNFGTGVNAVAVQSDGQILVGGYFGFDPSTGVGNGSGIVRLNPDGSVDASFNVGTGVNGLVTDVRLQPDGRIVIGGEFTTFNGVPRGSVVRLNANGSLDTSFYPGTGVDFGFVEKLAIQLDGRILVRGSFETFNGSALPGLARLNADGSLDYGFAPSLTLGSSNYAFGLQGDGGILTGTNDGQVVRLESGSGHPEFFDGEQPVGSDFYYLVFPGGNLFGYYSYDYFPYIYHADLGFEYFLDAGDAAHGAFLYDFASSGWFYTSPSFPFPYLYDFSLNAVVYYYSDPERGGHYTTNPRYFYDFATGEIVTK